MWVLRHVVWGGLPGESKGLSRAWGKDARRRSGGDLQTVLVDLPLPWPLLRELAGTAADSCSKKRTCHQLAVRRSLRAFAAEVGSRKTAFATEQAAAMQARASAMGRGQREIGRGRPFAGAVLGPPPPCDARACACNTWRERASRVGVYVASRKDTHHGGGECQSGTPEQGDLPAAKQVVEPTRRHGPHGGQQIAHTLRHA